MSEEATGATTAPDAGADAPAGDTQESGEPTAPTPVREGLTPKQSGREGTREIGERFRDAYEGTAEGPTPEAGESEPPSETPEEPTETEPEPTAEDVQAEEVAAEEAVTADQGPEQEELPDGWQYDEQGALHDGHGHYRNEEQLQQAREQAAQEARLEGFVEEELDPTHPLRDRGLETVHLPGPDVLPGGEAEYEALRSALNNPVRNRQVEQANQRAMQANRRATELEARMEIMQSPEFRQLDPEQNPELRDQIEDHRRAYGDEAAEELVKSLEARREKMLEERTEEASSQAEWDAAAQQFMQTVGQHAERVFPVWAQNGELREKLAQLIPHYSRLVDAGQARPDPRQFFDWAWKSAYAWDPRVQRQAKEGAGQPQAETPSADGASEPKTREELKAELREEIKEELKAEEAERLEDSARRRSRTPPGNLPAADAGLRTPRDDSPDNAGKSPGQVKKEGLARVKERLGLSR